MRFRIKLYREMKLWLVAGPALVVVGFAANGADVVRAQFPSSSWGRVYWEMATVFLGIVCAFGILATVLCTVLLLGQRLGTSRFAEWFTTDD